MTSPGTRLPRRYTRSSTTTLPSSGMLQTSKQRPHLGNHDCSDRAWCIVERPSLVWFASRLTVLRGDCDDVTHTHTHTHTPKADTRRLLLAVYDRNHQPLKHCRLQRRRFSALAGARGDGHNCRHNSNGVFEITAGKDALLFVLASAFYPSLLLVVRNLRLIMHAC